MSTGKLDMAEECLLHAMDLSGLLLLYSSLGDAEGLTKLTSMAKEQGKNNVAFLCFFMLGKLEECLQLLIESNRIPEAALMSRSYLPSKVPEIVTLWKKDLQKVNPKAAESLADPNEYPNLFEDWQIALNVEANVAPKRGIYAPAKEYIIHAERPNETLVEAFKNMRIHQEEVLPDENGDDTHEAIEENGVEESQEDAVEVDVEADGSTDGAVLVNGNDTEEQWGTNNEESSA
jgi:coatomer subunit beta'